MPVASHIAQLFRKLFRLICLSASVRRLVRPGLVVWIVSGNLTVKAHQLDSLRVNVQRAGGFPAKAIALAKFSFSLASSKPDSALGLAHECLQIAEKIRVDSIIAAAYNSIGWSYFRLGRKDSA